jgi:hypothetical protein
VNVDNLEAALNRRPFKPFEIRVDGEVLTVDHPEQVLLTQEKSTVVVADRQEHLHIFDSDQISKIRLIHSRKPSH